MEPLEKIKQIVDDSQDINILPSPEPEKDGFLAALALFYSLKKLGKNVNLLINSHPERFNFLIKEEFQTDQANFVISIREREAKLTQLFYEKTDNGLNLFLKTSGGNIKPEDIVLQPLLNNETTNNNILITVGVAAKSKITPLFNLQSNLIINIDNQSKNENYGQVNLVEAGSLSISEVVLDIIRRLDKNLIDKNIAEIILAGIIEGTLNFQNPRTNATTIQKVNYLLENGADFKKIINHLYPVRDFASDRFDEISNQGSLRLFGAVLSKINILPKQNLNWVILDEEDFNQTQSCSADLKFTLKKLTSNLFPSRHFFCLWKESFSPTVIRGVFYSPSENLLEKMATSFEGMRKGQGILFQVPIGTGALTEHAEKISLEDIKDKILEIIKV